MLHALLGTAEFAAVDIVRLRFELALALGLAVALACCRRSGVLPTVLVAGAAWFGASAFLLLEMQQLDLHQRAGGGERVIALCWFADATAALGKAWIASVLGAALCLAALSSGGRGREIERLLASALAASVAVAAAQVTLAVLALFVAHVVSSTPGSRRRLEIAVAGALLALLLALVAWLGQGGSLEPEPDLRGQSKVATGTICVWLVAWFAQEARVGSAAHLRRGAPGAPRFWRDIGLRLAWIAVALRISGALLFERASEASFALAENAAWVGPVCGLAGFLFAMRAHWLQWRARDLASWGRGTLCAGAALAPLALLSTSGAGLRGAAVAGCLLAVQGALVHAALAVERREPLSAAPWWLGGCALALALPLPTLLGAQARSAIFELASEASTPWLHVGLAVEWLGGGALGLFGLLRLQRLAQRRRAAEALFVGARWPRWAAAALCAIAALCTSLGPSIDARLRSGRLHGIANRGSADDFLGRRYERRSEGSSRRASSSAVLRSVPALRHPTMSAQGI
ncbi:MAG: hypothetical protein JNM84_21740 [Planctomycetes bacterium]|nr:hypothetical protein [Planctomycetota bacterium]